MMKRRARGFRDAAATQDFWPSFTDVMSTVAMLLFFLMLLSYIQNILTGKQLTVSRAELEDTRRQLAALNTELEGSEQSLAAARRSLEQTEEEIAGMGEQLAATERAISEKEDALAYLEDEIEAARAEIEEGRRQLTVSQLEVEQQREIIAASNLELGDLRAKLSDIAVLRVSILDRVRNSIEEAIGKYTDSGEERVTIGPNANIVINERLLFDYDSSVVKADAGQMLSQLAVAFEQLLDDEQTRLYIDYVSIEGHTDATGSAGYNRGLSADRAVSVVNYMMESNPALEQKYAGYFGTGGFSKFRPLAEGEDDESMARNRRIEISVVVKDDNIRRMIEDYLGAGTQADGASDHADETSSGAEVIAPEAAQ